MERWSSDDEGDLDRTFSQIKKLFDIPSSLNARIPRSPRNG